MKHIAISLIVPLLVAGSASAAVGQPPDPFEIGAPTRSVPDSNYWTYVLGPCYVPWYGPDYRHCGVPSRRSVADADGRSARRSGGVVYRQSSKGRIAAY